SSGATSCTRSLSGTMSTRPGGTGGGTGSPGRSGGDPSPSSTRSPGSGSGGRRRGRKEARRDRGGVPTARTAPARAEGAVADRRTQRVLRSRDCALWVRAGRHLVAPALHGGGARGGNRRRLLRLGMARDRSDGARGVPEPDGACGRNDVGRPTPWRHDARPVEGGATWIAFATAGRSRR